MFSGVIHTHLETQKTPTKRVVGPFRPPTKEEEEEAKRKLEEDLKQDDSDDDGPVVGPRIISSEEAEIIAEINEQKRRENEAEEWKRLKDGKPKTSDSKVNLYH